MNKKSRYPKKVAAFFIAQFNFLLPNSIKTNAHKYCCAAVCLKACYYFCKNILIASSTLSASTEVLTQGPNGRWFTTPYTGKAATSRTPLVKSRWQATAITHLGRFCLIICRATVPPGTMVTSTPYLSPKLSSAPTVQAPLHSGGAA